MSETVEQIQERLLAQLKKRGATGIRGLARAFKICDNDGSKELDIYEFTKVGPSRAVAERRVLYLRLISELLPTLAHRLSTSAS